jgi:predicted RNase H-like HicB family nuclease
MPEPERSRMSYYLDVSQDDDGTWRVSIPDLPGVTATGATEKEMQDNLIRAYVRHQSAS